eukprot:366407-Chlamydomonas_euryale.AAC.5
MNGERGMGVLGSSTAGASMPTWVGTRNNPRQRHGQSRRMGGAWPCRSACGRCLALPQCMRTPQGLSQCMRTPHGLSQCMGTPHGLSQCMGTPHGISQAHGNAAAPLRARQQLCTLPGSSPLCRAHPPCMLPYQMPSSPLSRPASCPSWPFRTASCLPPRVVPLLALPHSKLPPSPCRAPLGPSAQQAASLPASCPSWPFRTASCLPPDSPTQQAASLLTHPPSKLPSSPPGLSSPCVLPSSRGVTLGANASAGDALWSSTPNVNEGPPRSNDRLCVCRPLRCSAECASEWAAALRDKCS